MPHCKKKNQLGNIGRCLIGDTKVHKVPKCTMKIEVNGV